MANDPLLEKRLRNVRRFELLLSILTPEEKEIAINGSSENLTAVLKAKGVRDIAGVFLTKQDWLALKNHVAEVARNEKTSPEEKNRLAQSLAQAGIGGTALGLIALNDKQRGKEPTPPPAEPAKPQTEPEQGENSEQTNNQTPPLNLDQLKSEQDDIESEIGQFPTNTQREEQTSPINNVVQDSNKISSGLPTQPNSSPIDKTELPDPTFNQIGVYPDAEIIPASDIDTWGTQSQVTTPVVQVQQIFEKSPDNDDESTPVNQPRYSKPRPARGAFKKRGRITKKALSRALSKGGKRAVARAALATIEIWGPIVAVIIVIFFLFIMVLVAGCSIVNNPIGDFFGANYCGNNPGADIPPPPPVEEQDKPSSVTFVGGEAYLSTADGCRVNCPAGTKGERVAIKIVIDIDTSKLDTNPANLKANVQISNRFFANIQATGNPKIISVPVDTTYFVYQWSLPNTGGVKRHYEYSISGVLQTDTGSTNAILTMSGVTITQDGNTSGENGGLYDGANARPTNNTCNKYGGTMKTIKQNFSSVESANYGDPLCTYSDAKLNKVIEQTETNVANQNMWKSIAKCETVSPNAYVPNTVGGSWGKFQMRRSFPAPFKVWTQADDRGDVPWQKQVENAVSYNNILARDGKNFSYWGTARCLCYYDKFKNTSACKDIIRRGEVRSPSGSCSVCTAQEGKN